MFLGLPGRLGSTIRNPSAGNLIVGFEPDGKVQYGTSHDGLVYGSHSEQELLDLGIRTMERVMRKQSVRLIVSLLYAVKVMIWLLVARLLLCPEIIYGIKVYVLESAYSS